MTKREAGWLAGLLAFTSSCSNLKLNGNVKPNYTHTTKKGGRNFSTSRLYIPATQPQNRGEDVGRKIAPKELENAKTRIPAAARRPSAKRIFTTSERKPRDHYKKFLEAIVTVSQAASPACKKIAAGSTSKRDYSGLSLIAGPDQKRRWWSSTSYIHSPIFFLHHHHANVALRGFYDNWPLGPLSTYNMTVVRPRHSRSPCGSHTPTSWGCIFHPLRTGIVGHCMLLRR